MTSVLHRPHPPSHLSHPPPLSIPRSDITWKTKHAIANSIACCDVLVARKNPLQWPCRVPPPATKGFSAVWPPGRGTQSEPAHTLIVNHVKDPSLNCRYRGGEALTTGKQASRGRGVVVDRFDGHPLCTISAGPSSGQPAGDMATDLRKHRVPSSTEGAYVPSADAMSHRRPTTGLSDQPPRHSPRRSSSPSSRLMMCASSRGISSGGMRLMISKVSIRKGFGGNGTRAASRFGQARIPVGTKHQRGRSTPGCRSGTGASDDQA